MPDDAKAMRRQTALEQGALVVAIARAGGSISFTEAEYQAVAERYGGTASLAMHIDVLAAPGGKPDEVKITLIRKAPANAELSS
jgi:hypothetical protein